MNVELQIMFHVLLFAVCVVIQLLREIDIDLIIRTREEKIYGEPDVLGLILQSLFFFVPLEIVFWILYWIFV